MRSLTCGIYKQKQAPQTHRYREQRQGRRVGKMDEGGQKVQVSSYKVGMSWGCDVQPDD